MEKIKKPAWESPVLMPLGAPAGTLGAICSPGGAPVGGSQNCRTGGTAGNQCQPGITPAKRCLGGGAPN